MTVETKTLAFHMRASHVITNLEPQKVVDQVETFKDDKANVETIYSTTIVMGGNNQAVAIVSCLVLWDSTPEDFRQFRSRLKLMQP